MNKLIVLLLVALAGFQLYEKYGKQVPPLYNTPYVAVYGRDSCGFTQKMMSDLRSANIQYHYFKVDDQNVADTLHSRMADSGLSIRRYNLPVVDVNGRISLRPESREVIDAYRHY